MTATVGVDVGGTFTDVVLLANGERYTAKVPSTDDQSVGVLAGIRKACEAAGIDPADVEEFTHAMTVSTNALLEGTGAETALVTTEGFRDVLEIGRQTRPALYDQFATKPAPLVPRRRRFEVPERTTVEGVETPVNEAALADVADRIAETDVESVAVVFLHAYADPTNERRAAAVLRERLDANVTASHEVLAAFREYERTATTAVDAYVTPTINAYLGRLADRAAAAGVPDPLVMQSNGGIADVAAIREHAVQTALSGPAAGVVGARRAAGESVADRDLDGLVTFDMGGTSSDVSLVRDGQIERTGATTVAGHPIGVPMVDVTTVGSGGGSVARVDAGGALRVGPESAGANPGPACYGKGGTRPTVTDANVVLGYIGTDAALGGELALDADAARESLARLADEADLADARAAAEGVFRVANAKMTRAIRSVTVERGYDPRTFGLVAFGGAGPIHAAALADRLDVGTVVVPLPAGVLSAYGLLDADEQYDAVRTHRERLADLDVDAVEAVYDDLAASLPTGDAFALERAADLRYAGQSFELEVPVDAPVDPETLRSRFQAAHERAYGYRTDEPVELVTLRATATAPRSVPAATVEGGDAVARTRRPVQFPNGERGTPVFDRTELPPGATVEGPAVFEQAESTTVLPPDWRAAVDQDGSLVLTEGSR
ncbi:MAG: hydantoinase/oxoprolinase family protein [Halobacterium sp.]